MSSAAQMRSCLHSAIPRTAERTAGKKIPEGNISKTCQGYCYVRTMLRQSFFRRGREGGPSYPPPRQVPVLSRRSFFPISRKPVAVKGDFFFVAWSRKKVFSQGAETERMGVGGRVRVGHGFPMKKSRPNEHASANMPQTYRAPSFPPPPCQNEFAQLPQSKMCTRP